MKVARCCPPAIELIVFIIQLKRFLSLFLLLVVFKFLVVEKPLNRGLVLCDKRVKFIECFFVFDKSFGVFTDGSAFERESAFIRIGDK